MPIQKMCQTAWKLLQSRLENAQAPAEKVILPHEFLQRDSSNSNLTH